MKLATVNFEGNEQLFVGVEDQFYLVSQINKSLKTSFPLDLLELIKSDGITRLAETISNRKSSMDFFVPEPIKMTFSPLYRKPAKIWGIGLNYREHAADLDEKTPQKYPASFIKPYTTIIGHNGTIKIPKISERTTGEAELGIIIGKKTKNASSDEWLNSVAGFTCIIDMTAEDILRQNPRYLTLSKSFDTFFSFGPMMLTPDEIDDVFDLEVATVLNNEIIAKNQVANMTFPPDFLVSFHSNVMTMLPGDIISTGTPRAVKLSHKDIIKSQITGFETLINNVIDLKVSN